MATPYQESVSYSPSFPQVGFSPSTVPREVVPEKFTTENKQLQQLAQFSQTLGKGLFEYQTKRNEQQMMEGYNLALSEDNTLEISGQIRSAEEQLKQDDKIAQTVSYDVNRSGESGEVAVSIQNMSGWRRYGYAKGMAEKAGQGYLPWLQNQFATNTTSTFVDPETGSVFTLADTARDPAKRAFALAELRKDYLLQNQLTALKPEFLNEYAGKEFRNAHTQLIGEARSQFIVDEGQKLYQEAVESFDASKDMNMFFSQMRNARKSNGQLFTNAESWSALSNVLIQQTKTGKTANLKELAQQKVDGDSKGRTYGELHASKFTELENDLRSAQREYARNVDSDEADQAEEVAEQYIKRMKASPELASPVAIREATQGLLNQYGLNASAAISKLDNYGSLYNEDETKYLEEKLRFEEKAARGVLTPQDLEGATFKSQQQFGSIAKQQSTTKVPEFKDDEKAVIDSIKNRAKLLEGGVTDPVVSLIVGDLKREYEINRTRYMQTMSPADASRKAAADIVLKVEKNTKNPNSEYFQNPNAGGRFTNYLKSRVAGISQRGNDIAERIDSRRKIVIREKGRAFSQPNLFFDKNDLQELRNIIKTDPYLNRVEPTSRVYQKLGVAKVIAQETGVPIHAIINKQNDALGLPKLPAYDQIEPSYNKNRGEAKRLIQNLINGQLTENQRKRLSGEWRAPSDSTQFINMSVTDLQRKALGVIARYEDAGAGYNAVNQIGIKGGRGVKGFSGDFRQMKQHQGKDLTSLTVGEIMALQYDNRTLSDQQWINQGRLHAVGRYQFIGPTLRGLVQRLGIDPKAKFTPELQDRLALSLLKSGGLSQWIGPSDYASAAEKQLIERARLSL